MVENNLISAYEIIKEIGRGGAGSVFLAVHKRLGKRVVLKADRRKPSTSLTLLRKEVDVLKNLKHPYLPQVYDFFIADGTAYTVMEFVDGESFDHILKRRGRISQPEVIRWAVQLLSALEYLHSPVHGDPPKGYIHSDIKPANMMVKNDGNICLIDFNISLALGEKKAIGRSAGYASPEHYGLDYSFSSKTSSSTGGSSLTSSQSVGKTQQHLDTDQTQTMSDETATMDGLSTAAIAKEVFADVRSDIYSTGATLYHLLTGRRPAADARQVKPLSGEDCSPVLADIVNKAMNPNPDLRYQTAGEMKADLLNIKNSDPRRVQLKRTKKCITAFAVPALVLSIAFTFVGLRRLQIKESWYKLSEYSMSATLKGDRNAALEYVLDIYSNKPGIFRPQYIPDAQNALTQALGCYEVNSGFQLTGTVEFENKPVRLSISADEKYALAGENGRFTVVDLETLETVCEKEMIQSANANAMFLNEDTVLYTGTDGVRQYFVDSGEEKEITKEPAEYLSVSSNGQYAAAVSTDRQTANIIDLVEGQTVWSADLTGSRLESSPADVFLPSDVLLLLDGNGSRLIVGSASGGLVVYSKDEGTGNLIDPGNGFIGFDGKYIGKYLAISAKNADSAYSLVAVLDMDTFDEVCEFGQHDYQIAVHNGLVLVSFNGYLMYINPSTGDYDQLLEIYGENINNFTSSENYIAAATDTNLFFLDENGNQISKLPLNVSGDLMEIQNGTLAAGGTDSNIVYFYKYIDSTEQKFADYDASHLHDETRVTHDLNAITQFSIKSMKTQTIDGQELAYVEFPDMNNMYDQQFYRQDGRSVLEITYQNGSRITYDALTGEIVEEIVLNDLVPDANNVYITEHFTVDAPAKGKPRVLDAKGKVIKELDYDGYLTYVTETDSYIVLQYMSLDINSGITQNGYLLDKNWNQIAFLPGICDIYQNVLYFDDMVNGRVRAVPIYSLDELLTFAQEKVRKGVDV